MYKPPIRKTPPKKILLIEEHRMGRLARKTVLDEMGYRTSAAATSQEAFELVAEGGYDLIVTDYRASGVYGVDLIQKLRKKLPHAPIVIVSGFVDSLGLTAQNTGADFVIQKGSSEVGLMVRAVRGLLRKAQTSRRKPAGSQPGPTRRRKSA